MATRRRLLAMPRISEKTRICTDISRFPELHACHHFRRPDEPSPMMGPRRRRYATNGELLYVPASLSGHITCGHSNAATARVAFVRPAYKTRKARPAIMVGMSAAPSSFIGLTAPPENRFPSIARPAGFRHLQSPSTLRPSPLLPRAGTLRCLISQV